MDNMRRVHPSCGTDTANIGQFPDNVLYLKEGRSAEFQEIVTPRSLSCDIIGVYHPLIISGVGFGLSIILFVAGYLAVEAYKKFSKHTAK
ncbi:MAG: hypothetical protein OHK0017_11820 [Patescibacteria group bacterium]